MTTAHGGGVQGAREFFDDYVRRVFPQRRAEQGGDWAWPGDEWVGKAVRESTYRLLLEEAGAAGWAKAVEFGPGSGKYTQMLLERSAAQVTAYEISPAFVETLEQRCAEHVASGRLRARVIDWAANDGLLSDLGEDCATIDGVFGVDVFNMLDWQSAFVYLISSACMLREGGKLAGVFADPGSVSGWERLVRDAGRHSAFSSAPSTRFHWVSRDMLEDALSRLGFRIDVLLSGPDGWNGGPLDIARWYVVGTLVEPEKARELRSTLTPAGDSTNRR